MKITRVEAIPFAIPYRKPLKFASGEVHVAEHVLVRVTTDDGVVGVAEAPPRPFTYGETQAGIVAVIDTIFAGQVVGLDLMEREQIHTRLSRTIGNPTAKSALDMAIWDALGQSLGYSVTELLGGYTDRMHVSHMLGFDEPAAMVAEAERMRDTYGITTFKVKVGRHPYRLDTAVVRALREGLGDDVELYVDGNRGWSASESARAMAEMADLGLTFAEELCPADDVLGRRWLVQQLDVPFIADESVVTPAEVTREVLGGSATAISIKTARTGFTTSRRVHHLAEGLGVELVMGNQIDGQLGSLCSVAFGSAFELTSRRAGELSNFLDMTDDLLADPLEIRGGQLVARSGPGLGRGHRPRQARALPPGLTRPQDPTHHRTRRTTPHPSRGAPMSTTVNESATAAASGASATERFHADKSPYAAVKDVPAERVDTLAREVLEAIYTTVRKHKVTYDEFNALKAWLIGVGEDGEWPLFLDVWLEHVVEDVATEHREGNKGSIEGPYYVPDAPEQGAKGTISMRDDEGGTPLVWSGQVTSHRRLRPRRRQGRALARRRRRLLLAVRPRHPRVEPARHLHHRRGRHASRSPRCSPRPTRSPPTARAASSSPPPAGTPGAPPTCTSRSPRPATSSSPPSSTSPATSTTTTTSPRP